MVNIVGFIKSTDHRPIDQLSTDHLPTDPPTNQPPTNDPPTHRPNNHRPNDKIIFKRLDDWEIFILQNTYTAGKMENYISVSLISIWLRSNQTLRCT